nr:immunoglobulin heavy chain junction region [Macaca mulatta]MPN84059.1 immunoglobulin heavy chain junction region [Macaca mulatta]MPN84088.1 immunoglobulin heavy chain junction region [Macaca mulatta]MPN84103.1 immunoglobulin heavy chain junction region [Macaca mulatta]MPN84196.1 immunoglobulin heavy chain junction region [Macaca mulatta]
CVREWDENCGGIYCYDALDSW